MPAPARSPRHPAMRPTPRLYFVKACALLCVAFPLLALTTPARAGHWVLTIEGSGQATCEGSTQTFTPPPPSNNSVTINQIVAGESVGPSFNVSDPLYTITASANLHVTVTGTWTADGKSDDTPPPPDVWLSESSTANATSTDAGVNKPGKADDGFQDPVAPSGPQMGTSAPPSSPKYMHPGSFTASLTLSASASGTQGRFNGGGAATASVGPITIAVHAQPYNWHSIGYTDGNGVHHSDPLVDNVNGHLFFHYEWSSTSGSKADLTTCTIGEYIDWSGNSQGTYQPGAYFLPSPPVGLTAAGNPYGYDNPTSVMEAATTTLPLGDDLKPPSSWQAPYQPAHWSGTQKYVFTDTTTGDTNVIVPGPDAGPYTIDRDVTKYSTNTYKYTVSSRGSTAQTFLP